MSTAEKEQLPELVFLNRQRSVRVGMISLKRFARRVLPLCVGNSADGAFALRSLSEVVVTLVSDRRIDKIHRQFMNILGATDVITFEHGEIVISAETAARCALEFGHDVEAEINLYVVHGLLHLNGYLDATNEDRERMHAVQNRIWRAGLPA